jgi:thioredoxin-like negative regulator of GroEL
MRFFLFLVVLFLGVSVPVSGGGLRGGGGRDDGTVSLDADNFEQLVAEDDGVWLVEIGSKFCGSCKQFSPVWKKLARAFKGRVNTGAVVVDEPKGMALATTLGALQKGIPAVMLFSKAGANGEILMAGEHKTKKELKHLVSARIADLPKDSNGASLKLSGEL